MADGMSRSAATIDDVPSVVPSPNQIPIFEELVAPPPRPRRPLLRLQPPLLADLTPRQRKAVTHGEGPLLIVLGHKFNTGQDGNVVGRFIELEHWARGRLPVGGRQSSPRPSRTARQEQVRNRRVRRRWRPAADASRCAARRRRG